MNELPVVIRRELKLHLELLDGLCVYLQLLLRVFKLFLQFLYSQSDFRGIACILPLPSSWTVGDFKTARLCFLPIIWVSCWLICFSCSRSISLCFCSLMTSALFKKNIVYSCMLQFESDTDQVALIELRLLGFVSTGCSSGDPTCDLSSRTRNPDQIHPFLHWVLIWNLLLKLVIDSPWTLDFVKDNIYFNWV